MSLLTRLGRKDGQNQQVKIFALQDDAQDLAEELSYQSVKHHIHQHILNDSRFSGTTAGNTAQCQIIGKKHADIKQTENQ